MSEYIAVAKDDELEGPVPTEWRSKLADIANALTHRNYRLKDLEDVDLLDEETAAGIAKNIAAYGGALAILPEESWRTSICQWQLSFWEVLVDLFTEEERRSDLVLHVRVFERGAGFVFKVHHVYVP